MQERSDTPAQTRLLVRTILVLRKTGGEKEGLWVTYKESFKVTPIPWSPSLMHSPMMTFLTIHFKSSFLLLALRPFFFLLFKMATSDGIDNCIQIQCLIPPILQKEIHSFYYYWTRWSICQFGWSLHAPTRKLGLILLGELWKIGSNIIPNHHEGKLRLHFFIHGIDFHLWEVFDSGCLKWLALDRLTYRGSSEMMSCWKGARYISTIH